jgi:hypothetical protein
MMSSRTLFLARLFGLYLIAVSLAMFAHTQATIDIMKAIIQNPPLLFIAGIIGVTAGIAIVLGHNVWSGGALPVIVTLFGWICMIKGMLLLLLSPATEFQVFIVGLHYEQHPNSYATFALLLGVYMTYMEFSSPPRTLK